MRRTYSSTSARLARALFWAVVASAALPTSRLDAQTIKFGFGAVDMYGGVVLAAESDPGVAFGGRAGFADLFNRSLHVGFELDWWTVERQDVELEVRDIVAGLALWKEISAGSVLTPFLGLSAGLHALDASRIGGGRFEDGESPEADRLSGYRMGGSGFGGLTFRMSRTGAIWAVVEYRYTIVSEISHHEIRLGVRLNAGRR